MSSGNLNFPPGDWWSRPVLLKVCSVDQCPSLNSSLSVGDDISTEINSKLSETLIAVLK